MLALKLLLVPAFLGLVSLVGRRWGPSIAGWIGGLPLVAGPILFFLGFERGPGFAAEAASASVGGVLAAVAFCAGYTRACVHSGWPVALAAGLAGWLASAWLLVRLAPSALAGLGLALVALIAAPYLYPRVLVHGYPRVAGGRELVLRMAAGALLTVLVTGLAGRLGAARSGVFSVFPLLSIVLAVFSQRAYGPYFAIALLRAMATALYGFVTFCFVLAMTLPHAGLAGGFALSLGACAVVQLATRRVLARAPR